MPPAYPSRRASRLGPDVGGADRGGGIGPVRDGPVASPLAEVGEGSVIRVEDGDRGLLDEHRLGGPIGLERAVEFEVLAGHVGHDADPEKSEEHTSELQSLMRTSYAVFCLKQ